MANISDMPAKSQWGVVVGIAALLTVALYFTMFKSLREANTANEQKLQARLAENRELETYRPKLADLNRQIESLKQQLDIQKQIVPDEKEADQFMHMVETEASQAGIEVRRYTARPMATREFYTEVPFEVELDGPYYSLLNFFERVAHLERIINVSNLLVASVKRPNDAKTRHVYQYAPGESVVATCVATTFFSHDAAGPAAGRGAAPAPGRR